MAHSPASTGPARAAVFDDRSRWTGLVSVTSLCFMWGFLSCLNDILIPHLKSAAICYAYIVFYGWRGYRVKTKATA